MAKGASLAAVRLRIHLQPGAARNRIVGPHGDALKVQVQAPPVGGAANTALVDLLAEALALPRRAVRVVRGATSRDKLVEIQTADVPACRRLIAAALGSGTQAPLVDKRKTGG